MHASVDTVNEQKLRSPLPFFPSCIRPIFFSCFALSAWRFLHSSFITFLGSVDAGDERRKEVYTACMLWISNVPQSLSLSLLDSYSLSTSHLLDWKIHV